MTDRIQGLTEEEYVNAQIAETRKTIANMRARQSANQREPLSQAEAGERVARAAGYARWRWRGVRDGEVESL